MKYALHPTSLGNLLLAFDSEGIHSIQFADTAAENEALLAADFPDESPELNQQAATPAWFAQIDDYLTGSRRDIDLPLALRGSAFQQRVWRRLQAAPYGSTITYTQLAEELGDAGAVRAVAGACAANRLALAVPCHRALRQDGGLAGFRWGLDRKRALLALETTGLPVGGGLFGGL